MSSFCFYELERDKIPSPRKVNNGIDLVIKAKLVLVKGGFPEDVSPELNTEIGTGLNEVTMVGTYILMQKVMQRI